MVVLVMALAAAMCGEAQDYSYIDTCEGDSLHWPVSRWPDGRVAPG
jgi:hypothetical protein